MNESISPDQGLRRRVLLWNALVTVVVAAPLFAAFVKVVNYYPIPVWSLFSDPGKLADGRRYYVLNIKTAGQWRPIRPIAITGALNGRMHNLINYTVTDRPFEIDSPHPENVRLIASGKPTPGARVPDLLRGWGKAYNRGRSIPATAIRLEALRWKGGSYGDYGEVEQAWEVEL